MKPRKVHFSLGRSTFTHAEYEALHGHQIVYGKSLLSSSVCASNLYAES